MEKHSNRTAKGSDRFISKYSLGMDSLFIFFNIHCITTSTFGNNPIKKNLNLHRIGLAIAALLFMLVIRSFYFDVGYPPRQLCICVYLYFMYRFILIMCVVNLAT